MIGAVGENLRRDEGIPPYGGGEAIGALQNSGVGADSCLRPWIGKHLIRHGLRRATFPKGKVLAGRPVSGPYEPRFSPQQDSDTAVCQGEGPPHRRGSVAVG